MTSRKLFPYVVAACFCFAFNVTIFGQAGETRARLASQIAIATRDDDKQILPATPTHEDKVVALPSHSSSSFQQLISNAIEERLGARYRWGATGPAAYDCSGFVWSIFQAAGINFERASARTLWSRFEAPGEEEKYRFGTLVFFSNLAHVGVVADEKGFYHASRHHGVIYSQFSDYWLARLDGFRKVPVTSVPLEIVTSKRLETNTPKTVE